MNELKTLAACFLEALLAGDTETAVGLARNALSNGTEPLSFFEECIAPSLAEVGRRFENLDIFLPEMVAAADVVDRVNQEVINPAVEAAHADRGGAKARVLLATVKGDLHDIGKNMVLLMLKVNGFEVIDLGTNVSPSDIVERAQKENVDIIGMSALLTTCLPYMKDMCDFLDGKGIRKRFGVAIGGAATNPEFARQVGADGHGSSAAEAVAICKGIMTARA